VTGHAAALQLCLKASPDGQTLRFRQVGSNETREKDDTEGFQGSDPLAEANQEIELQSRYNDKQCKKSGKHKKDRKKTIAGMTADIDTQEKRSCCTTGRKAREFPEILSLRRFSRLFVGFFPDNS